MSYAFCMRNHITCVLYGDSVERAWIEYQSFQNLHKLVAVLQFGLVRSQQGVSSLTSYVYAAKVFWNPTIYEILPMRGALLHLSGRP